MTLTRAGGIYIGLTLLLGFAAVNTGNNLLYLLVSALLGFMAVSGLLGRQNLTGLRCSVEPPEEIFDGAETLLHLRLVNPGRLPRFLLRLELEEHAVLVPVIGGRSEAAAPLRMLFRGRGRRRIEELLVTSIFPVNFFVRRRRLRTPSEILVFPAPRACRPAGTGGRSQPAGESPGQQRGFEGEISRIGGYRGGDPLKFIHWRLSARQGQLLVKELSAPVQEPVWLEPEAMPGATLEERLGCSAYWVIRLLRAQRPVGLRLGPVAIPPALGRGQRIRLLGALATHGTD